MTPATGDPSRVRLADARDEDELLDLCRSLHAENGMFPMSEPKVSQILRAALEGPIAFRRGLIGVIGPRHGIEGAIFLEVGSNWYSTQLYLNEMFNYVLPQYRNSTNSADLIAFAKQMSDQFQVALLIGVLSTIRTEAKIRHYRRQLGEPIGAFFVHNGGAGVH